MNAPHDLPPMMPDPSASDFSSGEYTGEDVTDVVDAIVDRLRNVRSTYARQVQAETDLAAEKAQVEQARRELAERQAEMESLKREIASKGEEVQRTGAQAEQRRAALAKLELDIQQRTADLGSREREMHTKQAALREERDRLEMLKSEVEEDRRNLVRRAAELERREADLTRQAAEALSGEDQAHTRQQLERYESERKALESKIREIELNAERAQKELDERLAEMRRQAEQREAELSGKLREQEEVAGRLRSQLSLTSARRAREQAEQVEQTRPAKPRPSFMERVDSPLAQRVGLWMAWSTALAFLTIGAIRLIAFSEVGPLSFLFGLAFGALYFGAHAVARRLFYPPALAVGVMGTTAGLWFPAWAKTCSLAAMTWEVPLDSLPPSVAAQVPIAFAVISACFVMSFAMLICTGSWAIFGFVVSAGAIAAGLVLFPDPSGAMLFVAALLWLTLVATALSQWGMKLAEERMPGMSGMRMA